MVHTVFDHRISQNCTDFQACLMIFMSYALADCWTQSHAFMACPTNTLVRSFCQSMWHVVCIAWVVTSNIITNWQLSLFRSAVCGIIITDVLAVTQRCFQFCRLSWVKRLIFLRQNRQGWRLTHLKWLGNIEGLSSEAYIQGSLVSWDINNTNWFNMLRNPDVTLVSKSLRWQLSCWNNKAAMK